MVAAGILEIRGIRIWDFEACRGWYRRKGIRTYEMGLGGLGFSTWSCGTLSISSFPRFLCIGKVLKHAMEYDYD